MSATVASAVAVAASAAALNSGCPVYVFPSLLNMTVIRYMLESPKDAIHNAVVGGVKKEASIIQTCVRHTVVRSLPSYNI